MQGGNPVWESSDDIQFAAHRLNAPAQAIAKQAWGRDNIPGHVGRFLWKRQGVMMDCLSQWRQ